MRSFLFLLIISLFVSNIFAQTKTVTAPNGQTYKVAGTDGFRGTDELWIYTTAYYSKKPPNDSGIDVYVVGDKIVTIQDRAGKVYLESKPDPGAISVGKDGYLLSANGAARRWILANLKVGDGIGLDGKAPVSTINPYFYAGYGMVIAMNGKTIYLNGRDIFRGTDQIMLYTTSFYTTKTPSNAGIDVLISAGKIMEIRDRAKAVFLDKKEDPGALTIPKDDKTSMILSANGEARKWIVANLAVGDEIGVSGIDAGKEVLPMTSLPCYPGAYYRKAVSSYDSWTGIGGLVKLGIPKTDAGRLGDDKQPLDNFSVYMGGNAGGKFEVDAGLTWEFTVDENGKKSESRNAFRPFWRTSNPATWNAAPAKKEFYFYPGETVQMAVLVAGPKKLKLIITDGKTKSFQIEFDAEGFGAGIPRQFKRVNAIDQRNNEGKPTQATKAEFTGSEWQQTILLRGEGQAAQQLPLIKSRFTDLRCGTSNIVISGADAAKGAEKIDIFGTPK